MAGDGDLKKEVYLALGLIVGVTVTAVALVWWLAPIVWGWLKPLVHAATG